VQMLCVAPGSRSVQFVGFLAQQHGVELPLARHGRGVTFEKIHAEERWPAAFDLHLIRAASGTPYFDVPDGITNHARDHDATGDRPAPRYRAILQAGRANFRISHLTNRSQRSDPD
jgi:hypothetical protein